ncbi:hypothetical protein [Streptomyces sp. NPDC056663]|uniref:hypothetical protein n=1 Tax=Streptomyces sp. NPDC056663 TaxID=3345899 RepID=UPI003685B83E
MHVRRDKDGRVIGTGGENQKQHDTDAAESAPLHVSSPRAAATIAAFLRTRMYRPQSLMLIEGNQALLRRRAENELTGLNAVPFPTSLRPK